MEDVCLDRMNAFVKSNIRLYLGMSGWHRPLHFVREQMLINSKKNSHFVSEAMRRSSGNRLVIAAERSSGLSLAQVLSVRVLCLVGLFAASTSGDSRRLRLFSAHQWDKLIKPVVFTALEEINAFRSFPEIVHSFCFEV